MTFLIDTNLLIWSAEGSREIPEKALSILTKRENQLFFSTLSIAEVAIKYARGRPDFRVNPVTLRQVLLNEEYDELPLAGDHAVRLADLPPIHKDPFDRLMIAQALAEGMPFVTADKVLAGYPGQVIVV